jgi:phosphatidylserine/phosphatidylglycerophosphate/cardiolipin synthase-like enzyme
MTEPQDGIGPVLELIGGARSAIELVMYQFQDHEVADALIAAERRGVRVRVLLNHGYRGQADPTNEPVYAYLLAHGVGVKWTPALYDLTHEKSLEVDGGVLVIMTFNLTPRYYSSGREFGVFDRDSSDIRAAEAVFEADWHSTPIRAPTADGLVWSPGSESTLIDLINGTHSSLEIYNEEMADDRVTEALIAAAQRGAAVRVCMTYATPWKAAFNELTAAGVQVRTYASTASLYIHAKMVLVDQKEVFIGSQNFSSPSLEANRELGLVLSDPNLLIQLSSTFAQDWASARQY